MTFNVTGKIVKAFEKKSGVSQAGKEWASQDFLIQEMNSENVLFFNVFGEENLANYGLEEGADVSVVLDARSREWNGRYYTELRCKQCYAQGRPVAKKPATAQTNNSQPIDEVPF